MIKNKKGYIIIFIIAVLGLFVVQIQFLRIGLNLARVQFDQQIKDAGTSIQQDLRERNQLTFLLEQALLQDNSYFKTTPDSLTDASRHFFNDFIRHRLTENLYLPPFYTRQHLLFEFAQQPSFNYRSANLSF